jgi:hypothetical protein
MIILAVRSKAISPRRKGLAVFPAVEINALTVAELTGRILVKRVVFLRRQRNRVGKSCRWSSRDAACYRENNQRSLLKPRAHICFEQSLRNPHSHHVKVVRASLSFAVYPAGRGRGALLETPDELDANPMV